MVGSMALLGLTGLALATLQGWSMPPAWAQAVLEVTGEPIEALTPVNALMTAGVLLGLGAGAAWLQRCGGFSARGTMLQRLARYMLGMAVVAALWFGLGEVLPHDTGPLALALRYLHAGLLGFWVAGVAPRVFRGLGLAGDGTDTAAAGSSP
jgi:hypothetical protein